MAPTSLTPTTPSGLSRSTATYFSSSLPPSSLLSWSLDHSCTTFGVQRAKHPRSTRLIEDEPDRDEEDHIRGIKRNRQTMETSLSSKRRCYPMMLPIMLPAEVFCEPPTFRLKPFQRAASSSSRDRSDNESEQTHREKGDSNRDRSHSNNKSEFSLFSSESCPLDSDVPKPPKFRRRSTIRDPFDLASSIEEFKDFL